MSEPKMYFICADDDDVDLLPDDYHHVYAVPVSTWLKTDYHVYNVEEMIKRAQLYLKAYLMFEKEALKRGDSLRDEPYVYRQHDFAKYLDDLTIIFGFKCENNGNTYRLICEKCLQ